MITQQRLKELLHYDPDTGEFRWRATGKGRRKDQRAGGLRCDAYPYLTICIDYKRIYAHRLAWLYMYGELPKKEIDHINHDRLDNRISNLREVSRLQNSRNQPIGKGNRSGVKGVSWCKRTSKWQAHINSKGRTFFLGRFENLDDAAHARHLAELKYGYKLDHEHSITETEAS